MTISVKTNSNLHMKIKNYIFKKFGSKIHLTNDEDANTTSKKKF